MLERTNATPARPYRGISMEGFIARWYARMTEIDVPELRLLAARIADALPVAAAVLEVAPGPGYLAIELARRGLVVEAADISETFVRIASDNARKSGVHVVVRHGDVHALPYGDESFDYLVCRASLKTFTRPVVALREMHRVLRPGAEALIMDLRRDVTDEEIARFVAGRSTNRICAWWNGWVFRSMLRPRAYHMDDVSRMAAEAGLTAREIMPDGIGFAARLRR